MRSLALLSLLLMALPTMAMTKVNVFEVEQPIEEQAEDATIEAEEVAQRAAMEQVIFRATGDKGSLNNEVVQKGIQRSGRFISQTSISSVVDQDVLRVVFNSTQIQALLAQANIPYWPEERETLLMWVVEEEGYSRNIAWDQMAKPTMEKLKALAAERGLPLTIPVGDIQDLSSIEATSLWGDFRNDISAASLRYPADAVVVIKIQGNNNKRVRWTLYDDAPRFIGDNRLTAVTGETGGNLDNALEDVVEQLALHYANKRARKHSGEATGSIAVQFEMMGDAVTFFNVEKALLSLPSVAGVAVDKIVGQRVDFTVSLIGEPQDFEREVSRIAQIQMLEPVLVDESLEQVEQVEQVEPSPEGVEQPIENAVEGVETAVEVQEPAVDEGSPESAEAADEQVEEVQSVETYVNPVAVYRFQWVN